MSDAKKAKESGKQTGGDAKKKASESKSEVDKKKAGELKAEADKKKTTDLGFLEEDDDFEEFPAEEFKKVNPDEVEQAVNIWEDDWDDDNIEDDFNKQLKNELQKRSLKMDTK